MTDKIVYTTLNGLLVEAVPEIASAYVKELEYWEDEIPGPHVIFADIFVPYLINLLEQPNSKERLEQIFLFLEDLAHDGDSAIGDVVALSVIDPLRNRCEREKWEAFLGPSLRKMLHELESSSVPHGGAGKAKSSPR